MIFPTLGGAFALAAESGTIQPNPADKTVLMTDGTGQLALRLNYDGRCVLDRVVVRGRSVAEKSGVFSGVQIEGQWFTTKRDLPTPRVTVGKDTVTVSGIVFGNRESPIHETWNFTVLPEGIRWRIDRKYPAPQTLDDAAMPEWNFTDLAVWKGGILGNGGVVWNKYLERPNMTYGAHTGAVTFWNAEAKDGLRVIPEGGRNLCEAVRFSHQPSDEFSFTYTISDAERKPRHSLNRFLEDRQDLWAPFRVDAGTVRAEFLIQAFDYNAIFAGDTFQGLDGKSLRELLNTVPRYGVIDTKLTGANGWRSGYICLHEPFFAQIALALNDPNYTANLAATLDFERDHAIGKDGRVKARWTYGPFDAMPGTFGPEGFYEAQWGYLLDSQPDYVINVCELFDLTADRRWLAGQKAACEKALKFLMAREVGRSGLVAMMTDSPAQARGSDWIDIIWASHENAFVNAKLHHALNLWSEAEEALGDPAKAREYRAFAERLKASFNRPIAEGGFWNPARQWYVYWRDKDGSVHGDNLVTPVNFFAIAYGLCDDPRRKKAILDRIESEMRKEGLFHWPLCFFPFRDGEGAASNYPFPTYENGDIFLSWGEVGVRAYAGYDPAIAVKYVKQVLDRYAQDGLSFQRYLRKSQQGAGDDILAGNGMAVVGLFRDIYGIRPRPNRLFLDPHLTGDLDGTRLRYNLRGSEYHLELSREACTIRAGNCAVRSPAPFAAAAIAHGLQYFPRNHADWELSVERPDGRSISIQIPDWPDRPDAPRRWTESADATRGMIRRTVRGLQPGSLYEIKLDGAASLRRPADRLGVIEIATDGENPPIRTLEIRPGG